MNFDTVSEYLTIGRVLSTDRFTDNKKHNILIPKIEKKESDINTLIETFLKVIEEETKNKTVAISLSGGKDSRLLVALCKALSLDCTCLTWTGGDNVREVKSAQKVSEAVNYTHITIPLISKEFMNEKYVKSAIKITDGNPTYFTLTPYYQMKDKLNYDIILDGNLMTEYMDTAEYRIYEGKNIKRALKSKEKILQLTDKEHFDYAKQKIDELYSKEINQVILERKIDRIISTHLRYKHFHIYSPITHQSIINEVFSLPLNQRMGSKLVRKMISKIYPDLLKISTSRSPFSLRYPLTVHQAYQKLFKTTSGYDFWKAELSKIDITYASDIKLDIIDKQLILSFYNNSNESTKRNIILRLLNVKKWIEFNG